MDPYIVVLAGFGALVLLTAWLPIVLKEASLSLPIVCVAIGAALFAIPGVPGVAPHPQDHLPIAERLTELVVIISLMGAGLKIDRVLGWRSWIITWRLLGLSMPLTILCLAVLGHTCRSGPYPLGPRGRDGASACSRSGPHGPGAGQRHPGWASWFGRGG